MVSETQMVREGYVSHFYFLFCTQATFGGLSE